MKYNRIRNILGWLSAAAFLLTTSCADHAGLDMPQGSNGETSMVTFTVQPQSQTASTRAVSDGLNTDVLIYAVYQVTTDQSGNEIFTIDESFGKGNTIAEKTPGYDVKAGTGQTIMSFTNGAATFQLSLKPELRYKVAFWAQNSNTKAYDTQNLAKVKVSYAGATNSDETRDAFCRMSQEVSFSKENKVILRRPFAQVNIGTPGWDYEGAALLKPNPVLYTQSRIELKGVAQYYNVLVGKALDKGDPSLAQGEEATTTAIFSYADIPAFISKGRPSPLTYAHSKDEDDLKVDLDSDGAYKDYIGFPSTTNNNPYVNWDDFIKATETFKYLSMCYVLVPEVHTFTEEDGVANAKEGAVLTSVKFSAKGIAADENGEALTSATDDNAGIGDVITIFNVPVQKNWRTNILGNGFFIRPTTFKLDVVPTYCGDYDHMDELPADDKGEDNWRNVQFDESDPNNWKLEDRENGTPNDEFNGYNDDYHKNDKSKEKSN